MRFAFFNEFGRVATAINDETVSELPEGAKELSQNQWEIRFDLLLEDNDLIVSPLDNNHALLSQDETINFFRHEIQKRLDSFAQTRGYDNALSCCSYADSLVEKFASEGKYMKLSRDQHWNICYQIITDVQAGNRGIPTLEQLFNELGPLEWPN